MTERRFIVAETGCSYCLSDGPCVFQIPLDHRDSTPVCWKCLHRMQGAHMDWQRDQMALDHYRGKGREKYRAKMEEAVKELEAEGQVQAAKEERREAVQAGLDAGEGERE